MEKPANIALVLGSSGAVGKALVKELTANSQYDEVRAITRRKYDFNNASQKLKQKVVDFDALHAFEQDLKGANDIFVALGTTRRTAGSAAQFLKIDQELTIAATKAAMTEGIQQKILYVSSPFANESSFFLYTKSKGATERRLRELGAQTTIIFRPGLLEVKAGRDDFRLGEAIGRAIIPKLRMFGMTSLSADVSEVAKAMRIIAAKPSETSGTIIDNAEILRLSSHS